MADDNLLSRYNEHVQQRVNTRTISNLPTLAYFARENGLAPPEQDYSLDQYANYRYYLSRLNPGMTAPSITTFLGDYANKAPSAAASSQEPDERAAIEAGLTVMKKWHEDPTTRNLNVPTTDLLKATMKKLCGDVDDPDFYTGVEPFREHEPHFKPPEKIKTSTTEGGRHLVISRLNDGSYRRRLISGTEFEGDRDMILHTYVDLSPSSSIWQWVKRKLQKRGRNLPKGLVGYFEDDQKFEAAIDKAQSIYTSEYPKDVLSALDIETKNEVYALLQYICYLIRQGEVKDINSVGNKSVQVLYSNNKRAINQNLKRLDLPIPKVPDNDGPPSRPAPSPPSLFSPPSNAEIYRAYERAGTLGVSTLNERERECILHYDCPSRQKMASAYTARGDRGLAHQVEVKTLEGWNLEAARIALANAITKTDYTLLSLSDLARIRNLFVMDLKMLGKDMNDESGVWFVPTNEVYKKHQDEFKADPQLFDAFYMKWDAQALPDAQTNAELLAAEGQFVGDQTIVTAAPAIIAVSDIQFSDAGRAYERLSEAARDHLKEVPYTPITTAVLISEMAPFHTDTVFLSASSFD